MKEKIIPFIIILIIVGGVGGGYWYFSQNPAELTRLQLEFGLITETEASGVHSASGFIEAEEISTAAETGYSLTKSYKCIIDFLLIIHLFKYI